MCNPFFWTLLEMCQRASEVFGSLDPPLQSMPPSQPHPCACTVLCCAYLSPRQIKDICPRKSAALPLYGPLLQPHPVHSHSVITNNPWLLSPPILGWLHSYQGLRHTIHISPLFSTGTCEQITQG